VGPIGQTAGRHKYDREQEAQSVAHDIPAVSNLRPPLRSSVDMRGLLPRSSHTDREILAADQQIRVAMTTGRVPREYSGKRSV
jgi:hypothetical protein